MTVRHLTGDGCDPGLLGGKGAALDRLVAAGFPVPPTAVVTTEAYRSVAVSPGIAEVLDPERLEHLADDEIDRAFLAAPLPPDVVARIRDAAGEVGGGDPVAVRSSATVEDLHGSSFAGQYRSELGVDANDGDAVVRAVALVWASLWHRAPRSYRQALGVSDEAAAMAVVIMRMVPARQAGVVFTIDPGGTPGAARVEAVTGLGERLVSGQETPRAWVIDRAEATAVAGTPPPVTEALALALQVERRFGVPQDVEWAWDGTRTWLVQARPITVVRSEDGEDGERGDGFDSPATVHELTTAGIEEMLPGVLPPLLWELAGHLTEHAFRRILDELGVLDTGVDSRLIRRVRGRAALDFSALRSMAESLPGAEAGELESQYFGVAPPPPTGAPDGPTAVVPAGGRRRSRPRPLGSLAHQLRVVAAGRRSVLDAEVVCEAVERILADRQDLTAMDGRQLLAYRLRLFDVAQRGSSAELAVAAAAGASYHRLEVLLTRHLGEQEGRRQAQLATAGGTAATVQPDASAALFAGPTWHELGQLPPAIERDPGEHAEAVAQLLRRLTSTPAWRRRRVLTGQVVDVRRHVLQRVIADTVTQLARRERTKAAILRLGGEVRRIHLELGRRLQATGALSRAEDLELLTTADVVAALGGSGPSAAVLARRRRYLARCGWDGPLPVRFTGPPEDASVEAAPGGRLVGWAASPGRRTARAVVIRSPRDDLAPGQVLVAAATDASWSPLFLRAGAIVAERGGPLSHAAILARELGLPAVLNLPGATTLLDGQLITVDGDAGVVLIHQDADDGSPPPAVTAPPGGRPSQEVQGAPPLA